MSIFWTGYASNQISQESEFCKRLKAPGKKATPAGSVQLRLHSARINTLMISHVQALDRSFLLVILFRIIITWLLFWLQRSFWNRLCSVRDDVSSEKITAPVYIKSNCLVESMSQVHPAMTWLANQVLSNLTLTLIWSYMLIKSIISFCATIICSLHIRTRVSSSQFQLKVLTDGKLSNFPLEISWCNFSENCFFKMMGEKSAILKSGRDMSPV